MEKLILFTSENTLLVIAIVVVSLMLLHSLLGEKLRGYSSVTPAEGTKMINKDDAIVIDVRENNEYQGGHILNSIHIPLSSLKNRLGEIDKHRDKKVIVTCRSGHRAASACASLKKEKFNEVYNLRGGIMAWESANLPLVK